MNKYFAILITAITLLISGTANASHNGRNAVTLWWVIFNNPDACEFNPGAEEQCGPVDVFGQAYLESVANGTPDPSLILPNFESGLAVLYGTGAVSNHRGKLSLVSPIADRQSSAKARAPSTNAR